MAIKDILVYLDNDDACTNRIRSSAKLCHQLGAHLTGVYITRTLKVHPYPYTYLPASAFETMAANADIQRAEVEKIFLDLCSAEGITGEFRSINSQLSNGLSIQSRYTDLLIIPQRHGDEPNLNIEFQMAEILTSSACPVLVLPENSKAMTQLPSRVMIGWNGSHESARALMLALPMLSQVEKVDIVSVSTDDTEATDIARHLARHDLDVNVHLIEGNGSNVDGMLLNQALSLESEMVVMGAYGHSRFREHLLGGATKYMLDHAILPVLYSH